MKKMFFYFSIIVAIVAIVAVCATIARADKTDSSNIHFLEQYGWSVEEERIEKEEFTIPTEFDEVYKNYNELQKQAGYNLEPYKGRKAVRYTYTVTNYPEQTNTPVRANVICADGKPIGGDVMTIELDGFMQPLNFLHNKD